MRRVSRTRCAKTWAAAGLMITSGLLAACSSVPPAAGPPDAATGADLAADATAVDTGPGLDAAAGDPVSDDGGGPPRPPYSVTGGFLRDGDGRALLLRGVNLSGNHKEPPYFDFHQPADYLRVRQDWGMNSIRFLVSWAAIEPAQDMIDDSYLDKVAERMTWAEQAGLLVVVDMHQDLYGEGFAMAGGNGAPRWTCDESNYTSFQPTTPWFANYVSPQVTACYDGFWNSSMLQNHYVNAWRKLAERLASSSAVVGFDPMNEPYWGSYMLSETATFEVEKLEPLYERIAETVREVAPSWIAFIEPASSSNLGLATGLVRFGPGDAVYSPHSYDTDAESGMGFSPDRRQQRFTRATMVAREAARLEMGLFIGEYGGNAADPGIVDYMDANYDAAASVSAGTAYWDYSKNDDGYGMLKADGTEKTDLVDTLVRPWPERVAGDLVSYAFDETTTTFTLIYTPDRSLTAPTEIVLPGRVYPNGAVSVDCGGCQMSMQGDVLRIERPGDGEQVTVTVGPP
jgi:endoglycosylceramidase